MIGPVGMASATYLLQGTLFMVINNNITAIVFALAPIMLLSLAPATAKAQSPDRERASVYIGTFITDRNTSARVDSDSGSAGSDVDLENDLGLNSSTSVARAGGYVWL